MRNSGVEGDEWDELSYDDKEGNREVEGDEWEERCQRMALFYVNMPTRDLIDEREYDMRWKISCRWSGCEIGSIQLRGPYYVSRFCLIDQRIVALEKQLGIEYSEVPSVFDRITDLEEQLFPHAQAESCGYCL